MRRLDPAVEAAALAFLKNLNEGGALSSAASRIEDRARQACKSRGYALFNWRSSRWGITGAGVAALERGSL